MDNEDKSVELVASAVQKYLNHLRKQWGSNDEQLKNVLAQVTISSVEYLAKPGVGVMEELGPICSSIGASVLIEALDAGGGK